MVTRFSDSFAVALAAQAIAALALPGEKALRSSVQMFPESFIVCTPQVGLDAVKIEALAFDLSF